MGSSLWSRRTSGWGALIAPLLAVALLASACSATSTPDESTSSAPSTEPLPTIPPSEPPEPEPYLPVPASVTLTQPGWALRIGEKATVAWKLPAPEKSKKGKKATKAKSRRPIAVVDLKVTAVEAVSLKEFAGWDLNKAARASNPFFVRATLKNVGRTNLSGVRMPLYIVDDTNTLIQMSTFEGDFKPCPSTHLPAGFKRGAKTRVCLVFMAPNGGRLTAVSFRPMPTFVPITWTGEIGRYEGKKSKKKK